MNSIKKDNIENILSDLENKKRKDVFKEISDLAMDYRQEKLNAFLKNPDDSVIYKVRKHLNHDALNKKIKMVFEKITDPFSKKTKISLVDVLMSAYAMFCLKCPSLLSFENFLTREFERISIQNVFDIKDIPSDTQMRVRLDEIDPDELHAAFDAVFREVQRGKLLEPYAYLDGHYILAFDGTGMQSSQDLSSDICIKKVSKKSGVTNYQLQLLGACIVHPDRKEVIPLAPEPISNKDGQLKNDCERNSSKRKLKKFRESHPNLKVMVTEDALFANAPHIRDIKKYNCKFIIMVKETNNTWLFNSMSECISQNDYITHEMIDPHNPDIKHKFVIYNDLSLNKSNQDIIVNVLDYHEYNLKTGKIRHFCWITDLKVTTKSAYKVMRAGRAKWKIENENFNTLKNQGYNLEHNYGLGKQDLPFVFANLMMLAFLVDQIQQISSPLFKVAYFIAGAKRTLWEDFRGFFRNFIVPTSMTMIYNQMIMSVMIKFRIEHFLQHDP